jgi:predicted dehydrogenase
MRFKFLLKESLLAGKHVFCEKPIAYDTKIVDELYLLAAEKKKVLLCGSPSSLIISFHFF